MQLGKHDLFIEWMQAIVQDLRDNPAEAGEPLYRLPKLGMQIRVTARLGVVVHFGVHDDRPLVVLKGITRRFDV